MSRPGDQVPGERTEVVLGAALEVLVDQGDVLGIGRPLAQVADVHILDERADGEGVDERCPPARHQVAVQGLEAGVRGLPAG